MIMKGDKFSLLETSGGDSVRSKRTFLKG